MTLASEIKRETFNKLIGRRIKLTRIGNPFPREIEVEDIRPALAASKSNALWEIIPKGRRNEPVLVFPSDDLEVYVPTHKAAKGR